MTELADLVMFNGNIITMDKDIAVCDALAVKGDRIIYTGSSEGVKFYIGSKTKLIYLNGKTVLPGFIDNFVSLIKYGIDTIAINLSDQKTKDEVLEKLLLDSKKYDDDIINGNRLNDLEDTENGFLTRWDIDRVLRDPMVYLTKIDTHTIIVNTVLLHKLKLPLNIEGICKDKRGIPNGILIGLAASVAIKKILMMTSDQSRYLGIINVVNQAVKNGITGIAAFEGGFLSNDYNAEYLFNNIDKFLIDIELFYQTGNVDKIVRMRLPQVGSLYLDGSISSRTAAVFEPYKDDIYNNGVLYYSQEEVNEFVYKAQMAGLQASLHAIGDRAIEQALKAFEYVNERCGGMLNWHRIEHCVMINKNQIARASKLNIILSMQPSYQVLFGNENGVYEQRIGKERTMQCNPLRDILDSGIIVSGGSDADVTEMSPLLGIYAALNHSNVQQRISVQEAIRLYTIDGAKGLCKEQQYGSLKKNKIADMVILKENPFEIDKDKIKDIGIYAVIKNGEIVYMDF